MVDRDLGIFHTSFVTSPYGTDAEWYPCHLEWEGGSGQANFVATGNVEDVDRKPIIAGAKKSGSTNAVYLKDSVEFRFILTCIPGAQTTSGGIIPRP